MLTASLPEPSSHPELADITMPIEPRIGTPPRLAALIPRDRLSYRTEDNRSLRDAVLAGAGIGFLPMWERHGRTDLHDVLPMRDEWAAPLWIVTHVDLHRTAKVQAFVSLLKERARGWTC